MLVLGPLLTLLSLSSCFQTILSGNIFACVNDIVFVAFGGVLFVVGIIVAIIGLVIADPQKTGPVQALLVAPMSSQSVSSQTACKKCGGILDVGQFFCPSCGQRPS